MGFTLLCFLLLIAGRSTELDTTNHRRYSVQTAIYSLSGLLTAASPNRDSSDKHRIAPLAANNSLRCKIKMDEERKVAMTMSMARARQTPAQ